MKPEAPIFFTLYYFLNSKFLILIMPVAANVIEKLITEAFPDAIIKITDLAGDNDHWAVEVTSGAFKGKSRIEQHKMVYGALKGKMGGELHAMQLKTSF